MARWYDIAQPLGEAAGSYAGVGAAKEVAKNKAEEDARQQAEVDYQKQRQASIDKTNEESRTAQALKASTEAAKIKGDMDRAAKHTVDVETAINDKNLPEAVRAHLRLKGELPNWYGQPKESGGGIVGELQKLEEEGKIQKGTTFRYIQAEIKSKTKAAANPEASFDLFKRKADYAAGLKETAAKRDIKSQKDRDALGAIKDIGGQIEEIDRLASKHPEWVNPIHGNKIVTAIGTMTDADRQKLSTAMSAFVASVVRMNAEGTRGFTGKMLEYNATQSPKMTDTIKKLKGKLAFWNGERKRRFDAMKLFYPGADLSGFDPSYISGGQDAGAIDQFLDKVMAGAATDQAEQ